MHGLMDNQKALLVTDAPGGLGALNEHLQRGWRVVTVTPMGGGGQAEGFAALVIVERTSRAGAAVLEEIAEEVEEVLEGDGSSEEVEELIERLERDDEPGA